MYAKILNGNVVFTGACPQNTERTSNFRLLDDEEKKLQGWYKVIEDNTQINEWQNYTSEYSFYNNEVHETKIINNISLDDYKAKKYSELANNTKNYVMSITPEYKQLSALAGNYPVEECDKIKAFGKAHVDLVRASKALIFSATSYEQVASINTSIRLDYDTLEPVPEINIHSINGTTDVVN